MCFAIKISTVIGLQKNVKNKKSYKENLSIFKESNLCINKNILKEFYAVLELQWMNH